MKVVLGIDAAWTPGEPSGCAVVIATGTAWRYAGVAPSYDAFMRLAYGCPVCWENDRFTGRVPDVSALLKVAFKIAGAPVDVVAVDMPVATVPITGRRTADNRISAAFGGRGCSTHSPGITRPGVFGSSLSREFRRAGYPIAHAIESAGTKMRLVEVYPHPALLTLFNRLIS